MKMVDLTDLPDEVLLRVLAGTGCKGILAAASTCTRLRGLAMVLREHRCFASAASLKPDLEEGIKEACDRALQGMLGCVDFALVFVARHTAKALSGLVVQRLQDSLPPGTAILGCATSGLMGVAPERGGPFELDPSEGRGLGAGAARGEDRVAGVSLLLGRLPGCRVRAFCNLPPPKADGVRPPAPSRARSGAAAAIAAAKHAAYAWLSDSREPSAAAAAAAAAFESAAGDGGKTRGSGAKGGGTKATVDAGAGPATPGCSSLGLQSVWVLMAGTQAAGEQVDGPGGLLQWLQEDELHRPVVSGGVSSGRGNLFFHPGRQLQLQQQQAGRPGSSEETACGAGTSTSTDTPAPTPAAEGGEGGKEGAAPAGLSWDAGASGLTFVGLAVMAGGGPEGAPAGGTHAAAGAGAGVGQEVGAAAGPGNSGGAVEGDAGAGGSAGYSGQVAAVRACALAMRGVCGLEGQPVFQRVAVAREGVRPRRQRLQEALGLQEEDLDDDDDEEEEEDGGEAVIVAGGTPAAVEEHQGSSGTPAKEEEAAKAKGKRRSAGSGAHDSDAEEGDDEGGSGAAMPQGRRSRRNSGSRGPGAGAKGGGEARAPTLASCLESYVRQTRSLPYVAVWLAGRGDPSLERGLGVEVLRSGRVALGQADLMMLSMHGIVAFRTGGPEDSAALDVILGEEEKQQQAGQEGPGSQGKEQAQGRQGAAAAGGGGRDRRGAVDGIVCCQLADITPQGCRDHLRAELPLVRSLCSRYPLLPGGRPDPRSWEGYGVVARAAAAAGARAGPVALAVFSCTGRGAAIFGSDGGDSEARIADEVLHQGVPFVGAFCNGELGPFVRSGYVGWCFNPMCVHSREDGAVDGAGSSGGGGGAAAVAGARCTVVSGGRVLPHDRTQMQGYTSVYAALG